jgi:hypothetical protein
VTRRPTLELSVAGALINALDGRIAVPRAESCTWGIEISVVVRGTDDDAFFSKLREQHSEVVVAYAFDVARANPTMATRQVVNGDVTWNLAFSPTQTNFSNFMEVGSGSTSADQFAKMRVERLLLNKHLHQEDKNASTIRQLHDATQEALIRGLNQAVKIDQSRFPELFAQLKSDPRTFLEVAWIVAAADLKLSSSVKVIEKLSLTLINATLRVEFVGRRRRAYANVEPFEIRVEGELQLEP